jgi:hypothetical protein
VPFFILAVHAFRRRSQVNFGAIVVSVTPQNANYAPISNPNF